MWVVNSQFLTPQSKWRILIARQQDGIPCGVFVFGVFVFDGGVVSGEENTICSFF